MMVKMQLSLLYFVASVFPATAGPFIVRGYMTSNNETAYRQML